MKDKLEVGHFIRTIKGIGRIEEITEDRTEIYFNCDTGVTISFIKKDFTQEEMAQYYKHSDNIIDLIEVGDYVNGQRVDTIQNGQLLSANSHDFWLENIVSCNEDIKSIVTKEQFESMKYKIDRQLKRMEEENK